MRPLLFLLLFTAPAFGEELTLIDGSKVTIHRPITDPVKESASEAFYRLQKHNIDAARTGWIIWPDGTRTYSTVGEYLSTGGDPATIRAKPQPVREVPAPVPFVPVVRTTTRTTPVIVAGPISRSYTASYPVVSTYTLAPVVVTPGGTRTRAGIFGPFGGGIGVENCSGPG